MTTSTTVVLGVSIVGFIALSVCYADDSARTILISAYCSGEPPDQLSQRVRSMSSRDDCDGCLKLDGRFVVFESAATDLICDREDENGTILDVFVRDRDPDGNGIFDEGNGRTHLIGLAPDGTQFPYFTRNGTISSDGRYVVFHDALNVMYLRDRGDPDKTTGAYDDQKNGTTVQLMTSVGNSIISADGYYIAFTTPFSLTDPREIDNNGLRDVYVLDRRRLGEFVLVSVGPRHEIADLESFSPSISEDGRFIAFRSEATNLQEGEDDNDKTDIFVHDRDPLNTGMYEDTNGVSDGTTDRVSDGPNEQQNDDVTARPSLSADGRFVVFGSAANNLLPIPDTSGHDIFVHDRQTGITTRVSIWSDGSERADGNAEFGVISGNGRYVTFITTSNVVLSLPNCRSVIDVYIHDRETGATTRIGLGPPGEQTCKIDCIDGLGDLCVQGDNHAGSQIAISYDGRYVGFTSWASNLLPQPDTNDVSDVFVRDRGTCVVPSITLHPETPETVCLGQSVTLMTAATGDGPLNYQWRRDCEDVGTNSSTLTIPSVELDDLGDYDVVVTNQCICGTVTSRMVTLSADPCPADILGVDATVGAADLLQLLADWGPCPEPCPGGPDDPPSCLGDITGPDGCPDCVVGALDLLLLLASWGRCPR